MISNSLYYKISELYGVRFSNSNVKYLLKNLNKVQDLILGDLSIGEDFVREYLIDTGTDEHPYKSEFTHGELRELLEEVMDEITSLQRIIKQYEGYGKRLKDSSKLYDIIDFINLKERLEEEKSKSSLSSKEIATEVYNQLFINNNKKHKELGVDSDDFLRDLQLVEQFAKKTKKR